MMRSLLTTLARRITREETFESLVAPALADLHFDATMRRPLTRHYVGLVAVIATALLRDLRIDIQLTLSAGRVWRRAAVWFSGGTIFYVGLLMYYEMPWHLLDASGRAAVLATALGTGALVAIPSTVAAASFQLRRSGIAPHRTIPMAALCCALVLVAFQLFATAARPAVNQVILESASRVIAQRHPGAGLDDGTIFDRTMRGNPRPGYWKGWLEKIRERSLDPSASRGGVESSAAGTDPLFALVVIPYAIVGVVLARGRGWTVFVRGGGIVITNVAFQILVIMISRRAPGPYAESMRGLGVSFLTAGVWLLGARLLLLPLLPMYALTYARKLVPRRSSLPE